MGKQKYDWQKMKMEFILSEYDEAKSFMQEKYKIYNWEVAKNVKGWWKAKQEYKQKIYQEALKRKWKEASKDLSNKMERYEMLGEEILQWMEDQFNELKQTTKKGEKKKKLYSNDIMNIWKIKRTEMWLPTNISKTENTNKEERNDLTDEETEALKQLLKKNKN